MDPVIPFNRAYLAGGEEAYLHAALVGRQWAGDGEHTAAASRQLEAVTGAQRVLLTTSCTHALEMAAVLANVGADDEVVVPAFTFVSTATAFALRGAKIAFADVRPDTLCVDERTLAPVITGRTRVIVPVHYAGVACEMEGIVAAARAAGALLVEDNAHGLFGTWRGRPLGSFGQLATLSFHMSKNISCGEGGALVINDAALVARAEIIREKGTNRSRFLRREVDKYTWVDLGSSWLPSDLLAAVLRAQLDAADTIQTARKQVWQAYHAGLAAWAERHGATLPTVPAGADHPAHLFYALMSTPEQRDRLIAHTAARGVNSLSHYQPLHISEFGRRWGARPGDCPVAERAAETIVRLPIYPDLLADGARAVERVIDAVTSFTP
jgi:dTDP-4-amino-4,6-dideoxygalactose transaminase